MRIISGKFKGRRLQPPGSLPARPTTDFAKTGLFNILQNKIDFDGLRVLDLFGGTGSISFEFLSRGADYVVYVDESIHCWKFVSNECKKFQMNEIHCKKGDVFSFLKNCNEQFDVIFSDPPYDNGFAEKIPDIVLEKNILRKNGILIIEHSEKQHLDNHSGFLEKRKYGNVCFSFFEFAENTIKNA